jgi:hypothetical protein
MIALLPPAGTSTVLYALLCHWFAKILDIPVCCVDSLATGHELLVGINLFWFARINLF